MYPSRRVVESVLPPRVAMRVRAEKNRRNLFGLHGPARNLTDLVPRGRAAVDAGANAGLYAYWIARAADVVHAFEPHPAVFTRLRRSAPRNVIAYNVALSDNEGAAVLHVPPAGYGEAHLGERVGVQDLEVATISLRTLDSYEFSNIGFLKIDVEGHEEALLDGAWQTVERCRPTVFVEIEERHNPGGIERVVARFAAAGYGRASFMSHGVLQPLDQFDVDKDQLEVGTADPGYANNFLFHG